MQLFCAASILDTDSQCALSASYLARPGSAGLSPPPPPHAHSRTTASGDQRWIDVDRRRGTAVLISRSCADDAVALRMMIRGNLRPPHAPCETVLLASRNPWPGNPPCARRTSWDPRLPSSAADIMKGSHNATL